MTMLLTMNIKKAIALVLIIFCKFTILASCAAELLLIHKEPARELAIINDPDGFTNVRSGPGKDFKVVDTLYKGDFFYATTIINNSEWAHITAWKGSQIEGYIHKSRIQIVEDLDNTKQKKLIIQILDQQKTLADNFQNAFKSKDSLAYRTTIRELEFYSDTKYSPILNILQGYFCKTGDKDILQHFLATMWADKGSANEMPSFTISDCLICKPGIVIQEIAKIKNSEFKDFILDHIEWGLKNNFGVDENNKSENEEYCKLKKRLDKERKKSNQ